MYTHDTVYDCVYVQCPHVLSGNMSHKVPELVLAHSTIVTLHHYILAAFVIKTHIQMLATPLYMCIDIRVLLLVLTTHTF